MRESSQPFFAPDALRPEVKSTGDPCEREVALHLADLGCRGCGRRAEIFLRGLPGVRAATVRWREERAEVRFEPGRTSVRDLLDALGRAGFRTPGTARPPRPSPRGIDLAIALCALANLLVLTAAGSAARDVGLAAAALAAIAVATAGTALGRRAIALLRRGLLDRDAIALAAAGASFAFGVRDVLQHRAQEVIGVRLDLQPPEPGSALAASAAIAAAAIAARFAEDAVRRAARHDLAAAGPQPLRAAALDAEVRTALGREAERAESPPYGSWDDAAARGIVTAALGCASFALVTHGCLGGGPLGPAAVASALAVLVVASPSAILAAGPAARAIAVLRARAAGVLVKDPDALLALATVDVACLEKNGTVTADEVRVRDLVWDPAVTPDPAILADVVALEQLAAHPAGRAIAAWLAEAGVAPASLGPEARVTETKAGIAGRVRGQLVEVGAPARFGSPDHDAPADATVVLFAVNGVVCGRFELGAPLHAGAATAIRALAVRGVRPLLVSGDAPAAAAIAARRLGILGAGGLGPSEKALAVRDLQLRGARVLLVGDGTLDPAVAAQADVAVAVAPDMLPGAVRAPIVLGEDRLDRLPALVDLGRALRAVLRQNAALAAVYNAALIPAAALGYVPPLFAAALALLETLLGLVNAARLLRRRV